MTINVARWGNSLAVRLPKHVVESAGLAEGASVNVTVSNDGTITLRSTKPEYTLQELLKGVTKENVHPETDWGKPVGKEFW
jgi:antitoxin MazE